MQREQLQSRVRGSMIGGAVGDALGYPVEFMSLYQIYSRYGAQGYTSFVEKNARGKAVVSDDTQMTLFTANGLLFGVTRFCTHGVLSAGLSDFVRYAYLEWLQTQTGVEDYDRYHTCWIRDIKELNVRRAPGNTCLSALDSLARRESVVNNSKGCGGIMRVAPVGLLAACDELVLWKDYYGNEVPRLVWDVHNVARLGGDCAALTHKHPLGYLPASFLSVLVYLLVKNESPMSEDLFRQIVSQTHEVLVQAYTDAEDQAALRALWGMTLQAMHLAQSEQADTDCIRQLGEGWTGDEALVIALYCAMRHLDSFRDAIVAAVNHDGDSDSTGAICGNIIGAIVGLEAIPEEWVRDVEMRDLIIELSDDMVHGCTINEYHAPQTPTEQQWFSKYVQIKKED